MNDTKSFALLKSEMVDQPCIYVGMAVDYAQHDLQNGAGTHFTGTEFSNGVIPRTQGGGGWKHIPWR